MPHITVNAKPTPSIPFIVVSSSEKVVSAYVLIKLAEAVEAMSVRFRLPKRYEKVIFPKAYTIVYEHVGDSVVVQDIVGVRMVGLVARPSPWCYTKGYWHPMINIAVASALRKAAETGSVAPDIEFVEK